MDGIRNRHVKVYKRQRGQFFSSLDVPPFDPGPADVREMVLYHLTSYLSELNSFRWQPASGLCFLTLRDKAAPVVEQYLNDWFGDEWREFAGLDQAESNDQNAQRRSVLFVPSN